MAGQAGGAKIPYPEGRQRFLASALYLAALICGALLLWPDPATVFLAACFSCLTLPFYRRLRLAALKWKRRLKRIRPQTRRGRLLEHMADMLPVLTYTTFAIASFIVPAVILAIVVAPQAEEGFARLQQLRAANLRLPPALVEYIEHLRHSFERHPFIEKTLNDLLDKVNSLIGDGVSLLVSQSFSFLGSTLNIVWLTILFLMLTVPFTQYSRKIKNVCSRALHLPEGMLGRFIAATHRALKALMLGIVLVATIQGALCGIGFYFAGIEQPAFWALLATFVAPIPAVGTALVWFPLCLTLWFTGKTVAAVGLALWGGVLVSNLDSALRPFFLRRGIKAPIFVLILSILCGVAAAGPCGLVAGPVLLAIAIQAMEEADCLYGVGNSSF